MSKGTPESFAKEIIPDIVDATIRALLYAIDDQLFIAFIHGFERGDDQPRFSNGRVVWMVWTRYERRLDRPAFERAVFA
jgi:hypothetical protein